MKCQKLLYLLIAACLLANHAAAQSTDSSNIRIAWDYSSMQQIAERGGYPRMKRLRDSSVCVIYETYTGNIHLRRSFDNGNTWQNPQEVFAQFKASNIGGDSTVVRMSNPEIIQLKNGDIVIACNYRPVSDEVAPFAIVIRRSTNNGQNWLPPQILYEAAPRFRDGCWEPSFLQLPTGELQVYFANENPYRHSDEQEISMISSTDNGVTWDQEPQTVSFRKNRRDGMPVAVLTKDEIVVAIEDNNIQAFKPYTVRTRIADGWKQPVLAEPGEREYALKNKVADSVYMGAPYLLRLPNGETLLSYQTTEGRTSAWERSTMEVTIGDREARNFRNVTRPFPVPPDKEAKWNSLALWDSNTVVALSSTNFASKNSSPWLIKGYLIPDEIDAHQRTEALPVFVGATSGNNISVGLAKTGSSFTIRGKVTLNQTADKNTRAVIYFTHGADAYKMTVSAVGNNHFYKAINGRWEKRRSFVKTSAQDNDSGFSFDLKVRVSPPLKSMRLGAALVFKQPGGDVQENLIQMEEFDTNTWVNFVLL